MRVSHNHAVGIQRTARRPAAAPPGRGRHARHGRPRQRIPAAPPSPRAIGNRPLSLRARGYWQLHHAAYLEHQAPIRNFGEPLRLRPLDDEAARALATRPLEPLGVGGNLRISSTFCSKRPGVARISFRSHATPRSAPCRLSPTGSSPARSSTRSWTSGAITAMTSATRCPTSAH